MGDKVVSELSLFNDWSVLSSNLQYNHVSHINSNDTYSTIHRSAINTVTDSSFPFDIQVTQFREIRIFWKYEASKVKREELILLFVI